MAVEKGGKRSKRGGGGEEGFSGQVRTIFHTLIVTHTFESQWPAELSSSLVYPFCALIIASSSLMQFGGEERERIQAIHERVKAAIFYVVYHFAQIMHISLMFLGTSS